VRGSGPLTFERPVEGEVVASQSPHLVWTPVDGATSYEITLRAVGRDWVWRSSSDQPDVTVPRSASLPGDCEIRAQVQPVPHDLAPTEGRGVMFRSGSRMDLVAQRLRHGSPLAQTLGVLGILLIAAGFRRRPA
jgi:hypothetical protein